MAESTSQTALSGNNDPNVLRLHSAVLTLGDVSFAIQDLRSRKPSRTCGIALDSSSSPSAPSTVPYYNILWAELSADDRNTMIVSYAHSTARSRLEARSLSFAIKPPGYDGAADTEARPFLERLLDRAYGPQLARRKRAFVAVNPNAGPGGADRMWEKEVKPIFEAAKMPLTVVRTKAGREMTNLCENLDIDNYDIVIPCSGDGGPYEMFNGLGRRTDARRALSKIAVCHIPCGSGNAFSCNIYGTNSPTMAALSIVKGVPTAMDLMSVTQGGTRTLSFLSQAYGIMADIDIKTEHMRWMGDTRFTVGFMQLVLQKQLYPCDIAYKVGIEGKDNIRAHYRGFLEGTKTAVSGDGHSEATSVADSQGLPPLRYGTSEDKLPEGWELIRQDKLGALFCGNMGYMTSDFNFFPAALHNDGLMDLITIDGDHSLWKMIALMHQTQSNAVIDNPLVTYRKVQAFRLIPRTEREDGVVSIDGESFPYKTFQAEVHPGLGLTLTKNGRYINEGPPKWEKA